ncbi:MAG TPA: hypothetical protein VHI51_19080 [Ktedonobacterales bacterium]|nr:hypothetical protein [Ktedonobacterales bacterium]
MATDLTQLSAPTATTAGQGASIPIDAPGRAAETIGAAGAWLVGYFQAPRRWPHRDQQPHRRAIRQPPSWLRRRL